MDDVAKLRYRLYINKEGTRWEYFNGYQTYFDNVDDALTVAGVSMLKGIIEEWETEDLDDNSGGIDIVDLICNNFGTFDFQEGKLEEIHWSYKYGDRTFPTPGFVFNYFKKYVDEYVVVSDIMELIVQPDQFQMVS